MKRIVLITALCIVLAAVIAANISVASGRKAIHGLICGELESRGYSAEDVKAIGIDHSFARRVLGFNEWRVSVEFYDVPGISFWFTYKGGKMFFEGVNAGNSLDSETSIAYSEMYKNGTLLGER